MLIGFSWRGKVSDWTPLTPGVWIGRWESYGLRKQSNFFSLKYLCVFLIMNFVKKVLGSVLMASLTCYEDDIIQVWHSHNLHSIQLQYKCIPHNVKNPLVRLSRRVSFHPPSQSEYRIMVEILNENDNKPRFVERTIQPLYISEVGEVHKWLLYYYTTTLQFLQSLYITRHLRFKITTGNVINTLLKAKSHY